MIEHLLRALADSGADAGSEELAEILWLAARIDDSGNRPAVVDDGPPVAATEQVPAPGTGPSRPAGTHAGEPEELYHATAPGPSEPDDGPARRGEAVLVRRARALDDPLGVMRALRPLGRRSAQGGRTELDEELSVRSSIEQRMVVPVLKPLRGRWLDLALVVDTHHSMLLWHDLVTELCRAVTQTGIFRDVRVWLLSGTEAGGTPTVSRSADGAPRRPQEISDPSGRRLVIVLTDTVADGWGGTGVAAMLRQWSAHGPTAVLNVLPRRLWNRGAAQSSGLLVRAARPAAPNATWRLARTKHRGRRKLTDTLALPVLEASPAAFSALASLVAGGGRWQRMSCLLIDRTEQELPPRPATTPTPDLRESTPDRAVRRFQASASPTAQELAGYLSAVPLTLPVMTLVRRAMLPRSEHGHLAEVALGGLFKPWQDGLGDFDADRFTFDFLPGVRTALLGSQLRRDITTVQELVRRQVAAYVDRQSGPSGDFPATRVGADVPQDRTVEPSAIPFARRTTPGADTGIGVPLDEVTDPLAFGVHPALPDETPGLPVLPTYVEREHDRALGALLARAAAGESLIVALVGHSCAGKSRAAWEAVRRLPPGWRLWSPRDAAETRDGLRRVGPRTVVSLEPRDSYEGWADDFAAVVRDPARSPVVFLVSQWPEQYHRHPSGHALHVPDVFREDEQEALRTAALSDPRIATALQQAPDGAITRFLSGAAEVATLRPDTSPAAGAVVRIHNGAHTGTGVLTGDGHVLTTARPICEASVDEGAEITVSFPSTDRRCTAHVVWSDHSRDLALLGVLDAPEPAMSNAQAPVFADRPPEPGAEIEVLGFPPASGQTDVLRVAGPFSGMTSRYRFPLMKNMMRQSGPPIPSPSSGSPVLDSSGRIIALVSWATKRPRPMATPVIGFDPSRPDGERRRSSAGTVYEMVRRRVRHHLPPHVYEGRIRAENERLILAFVRFLAARIPAPAWTAAGRPHYLRSDAPDTYEALERELATDLRTFLEADGLSLKASQVDRGPDFYCGSAPGWSGAPLEVAVNRGGPRPTHAMWPRQAGMLQHDTKPQSRALSPVSFLLELDLTEDQFTLPPLSRCVSVAGTDRPGPNAAESCVVVLRLPARQTDSGPVEPAIAPEALFPEGWSLPDEPEEYEPEAYVPDDEPEAYVRPGGNPSSELDRNAFGELDHYPFDDPDRHPFDDPDHHPFDGPDDNPFDDQDYELPVSLDMAVRDAVVSACENLVGQEVVGPLDDYERQTRGLGLSGIGVPTDVETMTVQDVTPDLASLHWNAHEAYEHGTTVGDLTVDVQITIEGFMQKADFYITAEELLLLDDDWNEHTVWISLVRDAVLTFHVQIETATSEVDLEFTGTNPEGGTHHA
ncbi:SAV_2336 N-terminal domain-related protein [Streptomyces sp. NPDC048637]|uniref:SAV_2336 N-terminal domain-related protein n=1 Tax=Streptomyces sp. NPDC048637 TaxID=3155636 RepID=UPI003418669B